MSSRLVKGVFPEGLHYLSGNEAAAEAAIARVAGSTPVTRSRRRARSWSRTAERLRELGGVFIQMEDEIASISAVIGAAWSGAKAMTATSGRGFSLMQEAIGYGYFTETPCVIVDVERAGPCTGQATMIGRADVVRLNCGSHGDYQVIPISPWSVQEMYDLTIRAFNLRNASGSPPFVMPKRRTGTREKRVRPTSRFEVGDRASARATALRSARRRRTACRSCPRSATAAELMESPARPTMTWAFGKQMTR